MIKISVAFLFFLACFQCPGQADIEYGHKSVYKAIERKLDVDDPELSKIKLNVPGSSTNQITGSFFRIKNIPGQIIGFVYVGRVYSCRAGGCSIGNSENKTHATSEYFDYFTLYNIVGQIKQVKIINYQATHGHEVTVKGWLKQFNGYSGDSELIVGKNIDGISGATISVHSLTLDVEQRTRFLNNYINQYSKKTTKNNTR